LLYYAQLDENNICIALSEVPTPIYGDNIIPRTPGDDAALGKRYNNGIWEETETEPEPTQLDRIEVAVNLSNEEIANAAVDAYTLELLEGGLI